MLGKSSIYNTIRKRGESLHDYRIKMGFELPERRKNYWNSWTNLEDAIKSIIIEDRFPSATKIRGVFGGGCARAIKRFGGIAKIAKKWATVDHIVI